MAVNMDKAINWFKSKVGKVTYSMSGSRNGSDGTGDCSGMVVTALYNGGASKPAWLYNTDSMHDYLIANGFELVAFNKSWNMQKGDVIITGLKGQSTGAAGHTAIAVDGNNIIDCAWYGSTAVNAVRVHSETDMPYYGSDIAFYVYRLKNDGSETAVKPKPTPEKPSNGATVKHRGTFINGDTAIQVRIGSAGLSAIRGGMLPAGASVIYNGTSVKDGYEWVHYTGYTGDKLFLPVKPIGKALWGTIK